MLGVGLVEYSFNAQKDDGFHELYVNWGYVPQSHIAVKEAVL